MMYHVENAKADSVERALASAITAIGTAGFVPRALDYLRADVGFRGCFLTLLDANRPPVHIYDNVRAERRSLVVDRYLDGAYLLDPFFVAYRASRPCAVLRLRDTAPDRFQRSPYFRQYYHSLRLRDELAILIDLPTGKHLFYSIGRMTDEPRFFVREIKALRKILPVFAAMNRRHFAEDSYASEGAPGEDSIDAAMTRFGDTTLTDREREIAVLVLKGHSSKSIARVIDVSPGTVKIHRKNIYRKLAISSQSELFSLFLASLNGAVSG